MAISSDPTVQRLTLRMELRRLRKAAKQTQKQVAESLSWSPSKLLRIESGDVGISVTDLLALLDYYDFRDVHRREDLARMAKSSYRHSLPGPYADVFSKEFSIFLKYESSASVIRQYQSLLVPGLLQTQEYAEAVLAGLKGSGDSPEVIARRVEARMERQELLDREDAPDMSFVIDEAALRRWVGIEGEDAPLGPRIMRRQLEHLKKIAADHPAVSIQIMPFTRGVYAGLKGPFVILEFADPVLNDLLYLENSRGDSFTGDDPVDTDPYLQVFWEMEKRATKASQLNDVVDRMLRQLDQSQEVGM